MILPDRETIHKLLEGRLAPEDAEAVFRQLDDELAFERVAASMADDHTFLDLLRNADVLLTQVPNPELGRLVRRFRASGALTAPNGTFAGFDKALEQPTGTVSWLPAISGFQILGLLGEGGMGSVFLAEDLSLRRRVALKVMKPEHAILPVSRDRFIREAQAAARIRHDNVVDIYRTGNDDGGAPFIAMPLLVGESLEDRLKYETISPVPMILKVGREAALGLQAAHDSQLIHRDIKPANLWLEGDPKSDRTSKKFSRTKILDFGLARCLESNVHLTQTGLLLGTPLFMSPEQGYGKPTDARSDLFSLGVVLYRMATGEQPFKGKTVMEVLTALAIHEPSAPKALNPDLPDGVSDLIVRLTRKDPEKRFQTAREVVSEIERIEKAIPAKSKSGISGTLPIGVEPKPSVPLPMPSIPVSTTPKLTPAASKIDPSVASVPISGEEMSFEIAAGVKMKFCWIPAGKATLGSPASEKDRSDDEKEHEYSSRGFWLAKYPVTQGEWKAVMGNAPSRFSAPSRFGGDRLPVERVCWYDSVEFCIKVGGKLGLTARYKLSSIKRNDDGTIKKASVEIDPDGKGPRLPLEDEWEYACRGGLGNERAFYWGDVLDGDKANCNGHFPYGTETKGAYLEKTSEVGDYESKAKHPWGLCDMSGNVYQWCESLYSEKGSDRVFRGGCWYDGARLCRSAFRHGFVPSNRSGLVGFRLAVPEPDK